MFPSIIVQDIVTSKSLSCNKPLNNMAVQQVLNVGYDAEVCVVTACDEQMCITPVRFIDEVVHMINNAFSFSSKFSLPRNPSINSTY